MVHYLRDKLFVWQIDHRPAAISPVIFTIVGSRSGIAIDAVRVFFQPSSARALQKILNQLMRDVSRLFLLFLGYNNIWRLNAMKRLTTIFRYILLNDQGER